MAVVLCFHRVSASPVTRSRHLINEGLQLRLYASTAGLGSADFSISTAKTSRGFTAQPNVRSGRELPSRVLSSTRICASHCSVVVRPMLDRPPIADATLPSKLPVFGRSIIRMYRTRRSAHGRKRPHLRTRAHSSPCSLGTQATEAASALEAAKMMSSRLTRQLRETSKSSGNNNCLTNEIAIHIYQATPPGNYLATLIVWFVTACAETTAERRST